MKFFYCFAIFFCVCIATMHAQVPRTISYQGVLNDAQGNLIPDGTHQLTLRLFDVASNGNLLYVETQTVLVVKGIFNAVIGSVSPIPTSLAFDRTYFLGVSIDGGSELAPRTALTSVPYALRTDRAGIAESLSPNATGIVTSINNQAGALIMLGAGGTTVTNNGNAITISSSGTGGTGIQGVQNSDNTLAISNPSGPTATINVKDQGITTAKIADGSVTSAKIQDGEVQTNDLGTNAVTAAKLVDGSVTSAKIQDGEVQTNDLGTNAVTAAKLVDGSVTSAKIQDGEVQTNDLGTNAVTTPKLADGSVTSAKIQDGEVQTSDLGNSAVTSAKIANGQVVKSFNNLKDDVTLAAGSNVTITPNGNTLTIAATGGGGANSWLATGNNISNTNTGSVGIGTSNPAGTQGVNLNVATSTGQVQVAATAYNNGTPQFIGQSVGGSLGAESATLNGNVLGWFAGRGWTGSNGMSGSRAAMIMRATQDWTNTNNGAEISFQTAPNSGGVALERMLITNTGNVGIGTATPGANLEVSSGSVTQILSTSIGAGTGGWFIGQSSNGTPLAPSATLNGNELVSFRARGHDGSSFRASRAFMSFFASENWTSSANGTDIGFSVTPNGSTSQTERMRITNGGNVGIGTTAPPDKLTVRTGTNEFGVTVTDGNVALSSIASNTVAAFGTKSNHPLAFFTNNGNAQVTLLTNGNVGIGTTTPERTLTVNGPATRHTNGTVILESQVSGNDGWFGTTSSHDFHLLAGGFNIVTVDKTGSSVFPSADNLTSSGKPTNRWSAVFAANGTIQTSDVRLKKDVTNLRYGLNEVLNLRPVSFQWKAVDEGRTYLGLIAQEVEKVIPEAIERSAEDATPLGMNYTSLVPVLIKAVQEQQQVMEELKRIVAAQKTSIESLTKANQVFIERFAQLEQTMGRLTTQVKMTSVR